MRPLSPEGVTTSLAASGPEGLRAAQLLNGVWSSGQYRYGITDPSVPAENGEHDLLGVMAVQSMGQPNIFETSVLVLAFGQGTNNPATEMAQGQKIFNRINGDVRSLAPGGPRFWSELMSRYGRGAIQATINSGLSVLAVGTLRQNPETNVKYTEIWYPKPMASNLGLAVQSDLTTPQGQAIMNSLNTSAQHAECIKAITTGSPELTDRIGLEAARQIFSHAAPKPTSRKPNPHKKRR